MAFSKRQIPNLLTIIRMFLVPIIIVFTLVSIKGGYYLDRPLHSYIGTNTIIAGFLFMIACITDFVDGYLARKNN
ncbi:CDP-diacylglycerol--glycerol-3-phosphate 3-phosphatidyltransferase [Bacteroidales bacterium Barb6]|nr:CDP-diacylglycerol--glycerol-3-phosphate 3-phosphatidyltransferase [Bacteroidales bacterium Barb6]